MDDARENEIALWRMIGLIIVGFIGMLLLIISVANTKKDEPYSPMFWICVGLIGATGVFTLWGLGVDAYFRKDDNSNNAFNQTLGEVDKYGSPALGYNRIVDAKADAFV